MIIIVSCAYLKDAPEEVYDYLNDNCKEENKLVFISDNASEIPLKVYGATLRYGSRTTIIEFTDRALMGLQLGIIIGSANEKIVALLDFIQINHPNVIQGIPQKSERKPREKKTSEKKSEPIEKETGKDEELPYPNVISAKETDIQTAEYNKVMNSKTYRKMLIEAVAKARDTEEDLKMKLTIALGEERARKVFNPVKTHFTEIRGLAV